MYINNKYINPSVILLILTTFIDIKSLPSNHPDKVLMMEIMKEITEVGYPDMVNLNDTNNIYYKMLSYIDKRLTVINNVLIIEKSISGNEIAFNYLINNRITEWENIPNKNTLVISGTGNNETKKVLTERKKLSVSKKEERKHKEKQKINLSESGLIGISNRPKFQGARFLRNLHKQGVSKPVITGLTSVAEKGQGTIIG